MLKRARKINAYTGRLLSNVVWASGLVWDHCRSQSIGILITSLVHIALPASLLITSRNLINAVVESVQSGIALQSSFYLWLGLNLATLMLMQLVTFAGKYIDQRLFDEMNLKVMWDILNHAEKLDYGYFEDPQFFDIMERAQRSMGRHIARFTRLVISVITGAIQLISVVIILLVIEPLVALVILGIAVPYLYSRWKIVATRYSLNFNRSTKRRWTTYFVSQFTNRATVPEVRFLGLGPILKDRGVELLREFKNQDKELHKRDLFADATFAIVSVTLFFFILLRIGDGVITNSLTVGDFTVVLASTTTIRNMISTIVNQGSRIVEHALYVSDLRTFLAIPERAGAAQNHRGEVIHGEIEFENVSFKYPGSKQYALKNASLKINPGEVIAFVGDNGSGKSTIVKLISRLYDVEEGRILIDGRDVKSIELEELYSNLTFKMQSFNSYEATALENISYGNWKEHLNDKNAVGKVIELLGMEDLISSLPEGYDTFLGKRFGHHELSGGQWQQIAIARAFMREVPIVILDEPTSSLDVEAEFDLIHRFDELAEKSTIILISHRFSTVSKADKIFVVEKGEIIQQGSHAELIKLRGKYADMYSIYLSI